MFVAQAHSFQQQARLAITLAWVSGYTNIVAFLACGQTVSHVTGTTSQLGMDIVESKWGAAATACFLLGTFLVGALGSGVCTELGRLRGWKSIYVLPAAIETVLLSLFAFMLEIDTISSVTGGASLYATLGLGSMAMGLQNATITRISGGVVRTTHVTGVMTDIGLEIAQRIVTGKQASHGGASPGSTGAGAISSISSWQRLALLVSILGSFGLGAALGTLAHDHMDRLWMAPPVLFLLLVIIQDIWRPIAEITPHDLVRQGVDLGLPESVSVFAVRRQRRRDGREHRLPNLHAWFDGLPQRVRVIVLDVADAGTLDSEALLDLRSFALRLSDEGVSMVIAGVDAATYAAMSEHGLIPLLPLGGVSHDLEFALAQALTLAENAPPRRERPTPPPRGAGAEAPAKSR